MLGDIIKTVKDALTTIGVKNVYSAFDAVNIEKKGDYFTVVGIDGFETATPIYSPYSIFIPYKTVIDISVTAPEKYSLDKLYNYYDKYIQPAIDGLSGLTCRLEKLSLKRDSNINRLVLTVKLSATGIKKLERSDT